MTVGIWLVLASMNSITLLVARLIGESSTLSAEEDGSPHNQPAGQKPFWNQLATDHEWRCSVRAGRSLWRLAALVAGTLVLWLGACGHRSVIPFREMRYEEVVGQTNRYTCGAAAVATLLTHFYGVTSSEQEILLLAEGSMRSRGETPDDEHGLTAYDLKTALERKGIEVAGFHVTQDELQDYFVRGGLPLIAHVTQPHRHFLVVVGMSDGHVLLADPSWGRCIAPLSELVEGKGMSGVVLVPLPPSEKALLAREEQATALGWMRRRLAQLWGLREGIP